MLTRRHRASQSFSRPIPAALRTPQKHFVLSVALCEATPCIAYQRFRSATSAEKGSPGMVV